MELGDEAAEPFFHDFGPVSRETSLKSGWHVDGLISLV